MEEDEEYYDEEEEEAYFVLVDFLIIENNNPYTEDIIRAYKDLKSLTEDDYIFSDYSAPPAHSGRSSAQPDRSSAHLIQSAVQSMLAADQHTC